MINLRFLLSASLLPLIFAPVNAANAQTSEAADLDSRDIIVTAERRAVSIQNTPLAISAISGESLSEKNITDFSRLTDSMPNVNFSSIAQVPRIFIRGVGLDALAPGADPRVAVYTDEVYNARVAGSFGTFYDLERIEILRGPQGTLYGRNATAGAINILSRNPGNTLNGYGKVTLGNYNYVQTEGALGGPLSEQVGARLSFQTTDHAGWGKNISTGQDVDDEHRRSVRGKVNIAPSDNLTIKLSADYTEQNDSGGGAFHFLKNAPGFLADGLRDGFLVPSNARDVAGVQPRFGLKNYGGSVNIDATIGKSTLTFITGYRKVHSDLLMSSDGTTGNYAPTQFEENSTMFTQELRWKISFNNIDSLFGAYYFNEKNSAQTLAPLHWRLFDVDFCALAQIPQPCVPNSQRFLAQAFDAGGVQKTNAFAVFTQQTWNVTDALGVDLGLRYSSETRKATEHFQFDLSRLYTGSLLRNEFANPRFLPGLPTQDLKRKWTSTDWKVNVHYQINPKLLTYATAGTAFKSGGFNLGGLQSPFQPEDIKSYEIGLKAKMFDNRLIANFAAFHYDYSNLQVNYTVQTQILTANAAKAQIDGFEAEISATPVDDLQINANISILDGKYKTYLTEDPGRPDLGTQDLSGNDLQYAPHLKIYSEIAYTIHSTIGDLTPRASVLWTDSQYMSQYNLPYVKQDSYLLGNLYLDLKMANGWSAGVYALNVADKTYTVAQNQTSLFIGNQIFGQLGAPRTFGISVAKSF